jgi:cell division protein FtsB
MLISYNTKLEIMLIISLICNVFLLLFCIKLNNQLIDLNFQIIELSNQIKVLKDQHNDLLTLNEKLISILKYNLHAGFLL